MREIDTLIIHCSATRAGQDFTAADIDRWHRERGFDGIGYHYVVRIDGTIEKGRDVALPGAHCTGWNARSIGICYIGGLDADGKPADTRTTAQKRVLYQFIQELCREYPSVNLVIGHRDTSPDLNGNGVVDPDEYVKACPCFDVGEFLKIGRLLLLALLVAFVLPLCCSSCRSGREAVCHTDSAETFHRVRDSLVQSAYTGSRSDEATEHIERTVYVYGSSGTALPDSVILPTSVVHTVIDRNTSEVSLLQATGRREIVDSLSTTRHVAQMQADKERHADGGRVLQGLLAIILVAGVMAWIWKKKAI